LPDRIDADNRLSSLATVNARLEQALGVWAVVVYRALTVYDDQIRFVHVVKIARLLPVLADRAPTNHSEISLLKRAANVLHDDRAAVMVFWGGVIYDEDSFHLRDDLSEPLVSSGKNG